VTIAEVDRLLDIADARFEKRFSIAVRRGQPLHTVYVGGDRIYQGLIADWGAQAKALVLEHGGYAELARRVDVPDRDVDAVASSVERALNECPIRDLRVDFEDGYGNRTDSDEDDDTRRAARTIAAELRDPRAPKSVGIRVKGLNRPTRARSIRTLRLFLETLLSERAEPQFLALTLPKVVAPEQAQAMAVLCSVLEDEYGLPPRSLNFEVQVEAPQLVVGPDGTLDVARALSAGDGRISAFHYGTYDYATASGIAAVHQSLAHPVAEFAKRTIQAVIAGTGVWMSDGSSNVLPAGNEEQVWSAWSTQARLVNHALERGIYQGWDLHPGQLPPRYAAVHAFYRAGFGQTATRLRAYLEAAETNVMDEPATMRALAEFLIRAEDAGAISESEIEAACGRNMSALRSLVD
jgi:hypothetical protein